MAGSRAKSPGDIAMELHVPDVRFEYENSLRAFVDSGNERDQRRRIAYFHLLWSSDLSLKKPINMKHIGNNDWNTLRLCANNYLRSRSENDWNSFSELFNNIVEKNEKNYY